MSRSLYEKNLLQFWKKMPSSSGFECLEADNFTCIKGPSKLPWSHYAWGEMTLENIEMASTFFKDQPLIWYLNNKQVANPALYKQIGLSELGGFPDMVIQLIDWNKSDWNSRITVDVVKTSKQLEQWILVCSESFGMDLALMSAYIDPIFKEARGGKSNITFFLGLVDGEPAGVSINSGGNLQSTIVWVGVLEKYRRQGLGRAMVESCLDVAKSTGSTSAMLNSFAAGKHLYETIGFTVESDYIVYSNDKTPCLIGNR